MVLSMTGYGKATCQLAGRQFSVEIKTLNSKTLDLNLRLPPELREQEIGIRRLFTESVIRGKTELYFQEDKNGGNTLLNLSWIGQAYYELEQFAVQHSLHLGDVLPALLRMNEATRSELLNLAPEDGALIEQAVREALDALREFREQEGRALEADLRERIDAIRRLKSALEPFEQPRIDRLRDKIRDEVRTLVAEKEIDGDRLEQEMIYYIEKLDINEEKVRLEAHCRYFLEVLDEPGTEKGRKLGFIAQEIGREINTIGSKAADAEMQRYVVLMKDELEKVKEQVSNLL